MQKRKDQTTRIFIDLFGYTVYVIFAKNPYKYRNETLVRKYGMSKYEKPFKALCTTYNSLKTSWCILPNSCPMSTAVHEFNHAVDDIIELHGLEGSEIKSYLLQYITRKIYG